MRQAIVTRYAGPTNHRGSRIIVRAQAGRMTVPWDDALDVADNHRSAARAFAQRWDWAGEWMGGAMPDDTGYAFVRAVYPAPLKVT